MMDRSRIGLRHAFTLCALAVLSATLPASGQYSADRPIGLTAQQLPTYLQHAGIRQHLNQLLPMTAIFADEDHRMAPLNHWIGGRPAVVGLVYYKCTMMCPQVLRGLAAGLKASSLVPGKDYDVVIFSIDPEDTSADSATEKATFISEVRLPGIAGATHFLTANEEGIKAISDATGFEYVRVPGPDGRVNQFAHSSAIMFVTPDGRLAKYISGIDYPSRDLRLAILDASEKKISNPVDLFLIYCCNYNSAAGKYSVAVLRIVSIAGAVTVLLIIGMIWLLTRRPRGRAYAKT